jgi:EAL domain-containing protein (putative c-di-GMP-specific phosphodiesterase class I)
MGRARAAARSNLLSRAPSRRRSVLDAMLDAVGVALVASDANGNITHANRLARELGAPADPSAIKLEAWLERLQLRAADGAGTPFDQLPILRALAGEPAAAVDLLLDGERGATILSTSASPLEDDRGRRLGVLLALEDVTARRQLERRTRAELQDAGLAAEVQDALRSGNLLLYAQPVVEARTGERVLDELLLRVRGADGTINPPYRFLAAAERYDTVTQVDLWVLERAVQVAAGGRSVAINVSALTVGRAAFLESAEYLIERESLDPARLTFEITESAVVSDIVTAARFAERLHDIGCHFALDDFGTGYAAFTYLKNLPIQYLKIDREFVRDLADNGRSRAVIAGIVSLASGFGQRTIAEGVESEATLELLGEMGVDMVQGFHVGRPAALA